MRIIALFLIMTSLTFAEGFPEIFGSAGDDIYINMGKYNKIKDLDIYADRPEFLESFCGDANKSMQKGYALDKMQQDPEATIDKEMIKSYAKELRRLANQNEAIEYQLREDIAKLYKEKDFKSLAMFQAAEIELGQEITEAIKAHEKKLKQAEALAIVIAKSKEAELKKPKDVEVPAVEEAKVLPKSKPEKAPLPAAVTQQKATVTLEPKVRSVPEAVPVKKVPDPQPQKQVVEKEKSNIVPVPQEIAVAKVPDSTPKVLSPVPEEKKVLTKLEYYEQNLIHLKEELYELRESGDQGKMACLNDITAMNYWMINLLKNERDACAARDAIKQMKSYDKSSVNSCGRDSIRYMEWHGRIKPYVGTKLFQAEAACNR
jgi:hypothetical protein